mgnify:CR=1 FL=1
MQKLLVELKGVTCGYKDKVVLKNVNLVVKSDECIGIIGPNGAGKTTLVKTLMGTLKPLSGEVVKYDEIRFGYVPQLFSVEETFPLRVDDVLRMPLQNRREKIDKKWYEILSLAGVTAEQLYRELSGGQKQKVLIVRALILQPKILILDEPLNDLDISNAKSLLNFLSELREKYSFTILIISHNLNVILNFVNRLVLVNKGMIFEVDLKNKDNLVETINSVFNLNIELCHIGNKIVLL